jgi:hypothetical protein
MAAGYDCADTENGDHIDDPSEDGWSLSRAARHEPNP